MTSQQPIRVTVQHRFRASPERVFDAWLDADKLGQWMFGPSLRDEEIVRLSVDSRVGGRFSFLVRRQGVEIDHVGSYRVIDRPRHLVFTWGIAGHSTEESVVDIKIRTLETGCELTLTHEMDPKWAEYADRTKQGWTTMVTALARILGEGSDG